MYDEATKLRHDANVLTAELALTRVCYLQRSPYAHVPLW